MISNGGIVKIFGLPTGYKKITTVAYIRSFRKLIANDRSSTRRIPDKTVMLNFFSNGGSVFVDSFTNSGKRVTISEKLLDYGTILVSKVFMLFIKTHIFRIIHGVCPF